MHTLGYTIWCNYFEVGAEALKSGRHETAREMFTAALAEAEKFDLPVVQQVASLHGLASAYLKGGRRAASEILLRKAFRIMCENADVHIEELADIACLLADSYLQDGESAKALPVLKAAAAQIGRRAGEDSPSLARLFKRIALIYSRSERSLKADKYFARATNIELKFAGIDLLG
jgi:Tfp pilus assembly protein PilF